jgi:hypothetical protein
MRQYQIQDYETDGATCPECGQKYSGRSGLSKHHAAKHGEKFKPLAACDWCGTQYTENVGNLSANDRHYCSDDCRSKSFSDQRSGESSPCYVERSKKVCDECGSSFEVLPSEPYRFCSWECYSDYERNRTPEYAEGPDEWVCEWCGDTYERYPSSKGRFCSRDCADEWKSTLTGHDHPLWEGGTDWYRTIRSSLGPTGWKTQRDEYLNDKCELCGDSEVTLALHHIIPLLSGGTNAAYNYMTLCRRCHTETELYTKGLDEVNQILSNPVSK